MITLKYFQTCGKCIVGTAIKQKAIVKNIRQKMFQYGRGICLEYESEGKTRFSIIFENSGAYDAARDLEEGQKFRFCGLNDKYSTIFSIY